MNFRQGNYFLYSELSPFVKKYSEQLSQPLVTSGYIGKQLDENGQCSIVLRFKYLDGNNSVERADRVQFGVMIASAIEAEFPRYEVTILNHFSNKTDRIEFNVSILVDGLPLWRLGILSSGALELEAGFRYIFAEVDENENDLLMLQFDVYKLDKSFLNPLNIKRFGEKLVATMGSMKEGIKFEVVYGFFKLMTRIDYYVRVLIEGQPITAEQLQDLVQPIHNFMGENYQHKFDNTNNFLFLKLAPFLKQHAQSQVEFDSIKKQVNKNEQHSISLVFKVLERNDFTKQADRVQFGEKIVSAIKEEFPRYDVTIVNHFYNKTDEIDFIVNIFVDGEPLWTMKPPSMKRTYIPVATLKHAHTIVDENENDLLRLMFDVHLLDKFGFSDLCNRERFGNDLISRIGKKFKVQVDIEHCFFNMRNLVIYYVRIMVDGKPANPDSLVDQIGGALN